MNPKPSETERFFAFISFEPMSGCWLWSGASWGNGYGYFKRADHKGLIPDGMHVLHLCDTPACCNPDHLVLGNHTENMAHRNEVLRQAKGQKIATAKLTPAQVSEIRTLAAHGVRQIDLSHRFGVHNSQISRIVARKLWATERMSA